MADGRIFAKVFDVQVDYRPGVAPRCWFREAVDVSGDL